MDDQHLHAATAELDVDRDAARREALVAYHASLKDPALKSPDELARARALVAVADAKAAYAAAGGSPGGRYSEGFVSIYDDARRLVEAADA